MTEQQNHLANLLQQRKVLSEEIDSLQTKINSKKELYFRVEGAVEYLQQIGVTLPQSEVVEEIEETEEE